MPRNPDCDADQTTKPRIMPRSFYVSTSDIWKKGSWSDPIYFDVLGIDPDVRVVTTFTVFSEAELTNPMPSAVL
jgi:hypothetical protein